MKFILKVFHLHLTKKAQRERERERLKLENLKKKRIPKYLTSLRFTQKCTDALSCKQRPDASALSPALRSLVPLFTFAREHTTRAKDHYPPCPTVVAEHSDTVNSCPC